MSAATNKDIPKEYRFFGEYFNFRKKFYQPETNDDYWNELVEESTALSNKYHSRYLDMMILVCVDDIEGRFKQMYPDRSAFDESTDPLDIVYRRLKKN